MVMHNTGGEGNDFPIPSSSITKNSDTSYTATVVAAESGVAGQLNFNFSSDTQGTVDIIGGGELPTINITKKP